MDLKSLNPHQLSYRYLNPKPHYFHYQQKNTQKNLISLIKPNPFNSNLQRPKTIRLPPEKSKNVTTSSDILRLMDNLNLKIPKDMYISLVKECTYEKDLHGARDLFLHVIRSGICSDLSFVNPVLLMLVSCGLVDEAREMFERMKVKDSNSWASMIGCYMGSGDYEKMIKLFVEMDFKQWLEDDGGNVPFSWIIVCVLKACVETENVVLGRQVHGLVVKFGYEGNLFLRSSLMKFYGNFGCLEGLDCVFKRLGNRNTAIWTNKLVNSCREHRFREAIDVFKEMGREGVKKNEFTFSSVLRACSRIEEDGLCGRQVHANLIKSGFDSNDFVQCGLVDMYAKCGLIEYAVKVFQTIGGEITMACWNAMLTGYIQNGYGIDAIRILYAMNSVGLHPQESLINKAKLSCGSRVIERKTDYLL